MWESTPPVVRTQHTNGDSGPSSSNSDLHQLGVVEVGKHVGLFHDGPFAASTRSRSTPSTPQPAKTARSALSSPCPASGQSPRPATLAPNARPDNPFLAPAPTRPPHKDDTGVSGRTASGGAGTVTGGESSRRVPASVPSRAVPLSTPSSPPLPPLPARPSTTAAAPLAASMLHRGTVSGTSITPAHSSVNVSSTHTRTPLSFSSSVSARASGTSANSVLVMQPTEALVEALTTQPEDSTPLGGSGGSGSEAGRVSPAPSSVATTATDGTEWVHWQRKASESLERAQMGTFPARPAARTTLPDPTTIDNMTINSRRHSANTDTLEEPRRRSPVYGYAFPAALRSPASVTPVSSTTDEPPPRPFTTTRTTTNATTTGPAPPPSAESFFPSSLYGYSPGASGGRLPSPQSASPSLERSATSRTPADASATASQLAPMPPMTAGCETDGAGTTEDDVETTGFYHGMSASNLERSFFFPSATSTNLYGSTLQSSLTHWGAGAASFQEDPCPAMPTDHTADASLAGHDGHARAAAVAGNAPAFSAYDTAPSFHHPESFAASTSANGSVTSAAAHEPNRLTAPSPLTALPPTHHAEDRAGSTHASPSAAVPAPPLSPTLSVPPNEALFAPEPLFIGPSSLPRRWTTPPSHLAPDTTSVPNALQPPPLPMAASLYSASVWSGYGGSSFREGNSFCSPTLASLDAQGRLARFTASRTQMGHGSGSGSSSDGMTTPLTGMAASPTGVGPDASVKPAAAMTPVVPASPVVPPTTFAFQTEHLEPFQDRYRRYQAVKETCTDTYLTVVEQAVDSFLSVHFNPELKSAATAAASGGRWGRAGQRLLQVGTTLWRRAGAPVGGDKSPHPAPTASTPASSTTSALNAPNATPRPGPASGSAPSTPDAAAVEMAAVRALHYTPDVISAHYMDERPSEAALAAVAHNYPALLCALTNFFPAETTGTDGTAAPSGGAAPTSTPTPTPTAAAHAGSHESEHKALRDGLILPTIYTVWRDYLTPLEGKAKELLQIGEEAVLPALRQRLAQLGETPGAQGTTNPTATTAAVVAEANALQSALTIVERAVHNVHEDIVYIGTIRTMDMDFCAELEQERTARDVREDSPAAKTTTAMTTRRRFHTGELSQYVPVFGLVLSRLHRLEMEHRTVLELWGPSKPAPVMRV